MKKAEKKLNNDKEFDLFLDSIDKTIDLEQRLIQKRIQLNLSQEEIAERSGMKQSAISRFEAGTVVPRTDTLLRYAKAVNLEVSFQDASLEMDPVHYFCFPSNDWSEFQFPPSLSAIHSRDHNNGGQKGGCSA